MKEKVINGMKKKLRVILATELNSRNVITAINEVVAPTVSYTFGVLNWNETEIDGIDKAVRKLPNMNKMFEIRSNVDRLYVSRRQGGRGLISVREAFNATNIRLAHYIQNRKERTIEVCAELDKKKKISVIKRAEKYVCCPHLLKKPC